MTVSRCAEACQLVHEKRATISRDFNWNAFSELFYNPWQFVESQQCYSILVYASNHNLLLGSSLPDASRCATRKGTGDLDSIDHFSNGKILFHLSKFSLFFSFFRKTMTLSNTITPTNHSSVYTNTSTMVSITDVWWICSQKMKT